MASLFWAAKANPSNDFERCIELVTEKLSEFDGHYEGSHPDTLFCADFGYGVWMLKIGRSIDQNCFHEDNMEAAGTIDRNDYNAALILYGIGKFLDVSFSDEQGNEIVFNDLSELQKYFADANIMAEAKRIGLYKPLKVLKDQPNGQEIKPNLFF